MKTSLLKFVTVCGVGVLLLLGAQGSAQEITTEVLEPRPILVKLEDLPAPDAEPAHSADSAPDVVGVPAGAVLRAPKGFKVNLFAERVAAARFLAVTPNGDILCAASQGNTIYLLRDTQGKGAADEKYAFLTAEHGARIPFGIAFAPGHVFVANEGAILRYDYKPGQTALKGEGKLIAKLPATGGHWTRTIVVSPDGKRLLVSIGSVSNDTPEPPPRAAITSMDLEGGDVRTFATGLRNAVGMAWEPGTHELYVCANERDGLGDDLVPDFVTRVREGEFFGWPYAYLSPRNLDPRLVINGKSLAPDLVAKTVTPDVLLQSHTAPLAIAFYTGEKFPERYRGGAFVTSHGSWNRHVATGYKIIFVPFKDGRPAGGYEDFVTGFLLDARAHHPTCWGRPVGVCAAPDGSLLFTDDAHGRIYRVSYQGP